MSYLSINITMENSGWKVPIMIEKVFCVRVCVCERQRGRQPKQCVYVISAAFVHEPMCGSDKRHPPHKDSDQAFAQGELFKSASERRSREEGKETRRTERDWN